MKRIYVRTVTKDEVIPRKRKKNKLNFLFDNILIKDIMQYRGITNYSVKKIPYSPKSLFRFFVNPNGLDNNRYWYLRINSLIKENPKVLHIYDLPNNTPTHFMNSFNQHQHQDKCISSVDCKVAYQNDQKKINLTKSSLQFNTNQISAYEKIVGLSLENDFSVVALVGPAGTGKTICLKQFVEKQHLFSYITSQNNLLQDATIKLGLNSKRVFTLCRFIMNLFDLNFYEQCTFNNRITGYQVQNFPLLFNELPVSVKFVKSLFSTNNLEHEDVTSTFISGNYTLFLCLDEFSMISYNILQTLLKGLEHAVKSLNTNDNIYKSVVILSGDCHQIQPIYTMKNSLERQEKLIYESETKTLETRYSYQYISINCRKILNLVNEKIFFFQQLRNKDERYHQFLNRILISKKWQLEIINYFNRRCLQNRIDLHYPITSVFDLSRKTQSPLQLTKWYRHHAPHFNSFNYFTWCNVDAHFINMSVFYAIYRTYFSKQQKETTNFQPRLAPIYFYSNSDFHNGYYDRVRLPFLPLILGMTYKLLINKANTLCRGQLLTLLKIDDSCGGVLTCIDRSEKIYKVMPTFFTMNLFCEDVSHFVFQNIEKIAINNEHYARMQKYGKLFGYPMQLVCGDTVRGSIGITVDSDLYINLSGCSLEEIYVILSRTTDERKIKAVLVS
ncbi:uncharacterized protein LOC122498650 [Leptopilina heterotoma]|uniref:uncharacterized protein LOC122498650 n=1 Tax=Leptopilina heterotoma TaxID=63436 RepID=UPI001CA8CE54|nr:uncharacterized protein LOC122498650 [Leptopilina heterotoma]XP_043462426.1 uncharacterized protein LOC122498650 [Leptopilina heterotoma]